LARVRRGGRFSNDPSYQERPVVDQLADTLPVLALVRQEGREKTAGEIPFWWPNNRAAQGHADCGLRQQDAGR